MTHTNHPHTAITSAGHSASLLIRGDDLSGSSAARQLIGAEHGGLPVSLFLVDDPPGAGPRRHRHPYPELFILHAGQARFDIDDTHVVATAGDILLAPAQSVHRFTNTGRDRLRLTAIHTAPTMETEWLEPPRTNGTP
jgi:quercetin dioxygenase-like cupin family protein